MKPLNPLNEINCIAGSLMIALSLIYGLVVGDAARTSWILAAPMMLLAVGGGIVLSFVDLGGER